MSNTKVSGCSSIRLPSTTNVKNVALRTVTKDKMVHIDMEKAKKRTKEAKPARPLDLLPLKSPQLIRAKVYAQANSGWNSSIKVKSSSSSSGSNSVESIVPKYKVSMNSSSIASQKRIFLNQTSTQKTVSKKMQDTKSFSSKFPNGLPFEAEFYHLKRLSSVASDSNSNVSSDEFASNHRSSKSPYANPEFERNPSNDALYVDFTLKPFDTAIPGETNKTDTKKHNEPPLSTRSIKTKYILTDENCFCEFETQRKNQTGGASCKPSVNSKPNKDLVVYVTSAHIFPQCNRPKTNHESAASKNT